MTRFGRITVCCVCGVRLPEMTFQEYRDKGMSVLKPDGSELHHCPFPVHTVNEIQKMITASPNFHKGNDYRKYAED